MVLIMSMLGIVLCAYWTILVCWFSHILPLRAIWFGSIFNYMGGGLAVADTMFITMIGDVIDPANRYVQVTVPINLTTGQRLIR